MEENGQDHEEGDDDYETVEFHNNELGEPTKIPIPPPTVLKKRKVDSAIPTIIATLTRSLPFAESPGSEP
ncbi:hypothetical protein AZE42_13219, partial [Rhizopogon vesiculosus]